MLCRLRAWEQLVPRVWMDAATTTTYTRHQLHHTLRRGLEVIAEDAIQQNAAIAGDILLRFPCCVAMRRRCTALWLVYPWHVVSTRALFVARRSSSCATYVNTWRNMGRSDSSVRSVGSGLAGPAPWCDTARSASWNQRTHYNDLLHCKHNIARKILPTKVCSSDAYLFAFLFVCVVFTSVTSNTSNRIQANILQWLTAMKTRHSHIDHVYT